MNGKQLHEAACPCGAARFTLSRMPKTRFFCHCTICQKVYKRPFSDVTVMLAKHVHIDHKAHISFDQYKAPPALDRGICKLCEHPVVGLLSSPGLPKLAFIPAMVLPSDPAAPMAKRHIHYGTRVEDVADDLPKTESELMSNLVLLPAIMRIVLNG